MIKQNQSTEHLENEILDVNVNKYLWNIADVLRGKMAANEYMNYILGMLFIRTVSDKVENYCDDALACLNMKFKDIPEEHEEYIPLQTICLEDLGVFIKPSQLWNNLILEHTTNDGFHLTEHLEKLIFDIEHCNPWGESRGNKELPFAKIFSDLDLTSDKLSKTVKEKNNTLYKIMEYISQIDRKLFDKHDVLGDAYEYLIGEFASNAGKKGGEFYTPQAIATLLSKIVAKDKTKVLTAYDPTCGSGSLLLRLKKETDKMFKDSKFSSPTKFYGQELNHVTYNLARMNMFIHGVNYNDFLIKNEDTLQRPQFQEHDTIINLVGKCDAIVANPPFSAKWNPEQCKNDPRFSTFGGTAPKDKADFAFVQHMYHMLSDNGTIAVVVPNGVLFRGAAEGKIRKQLIQNNVLEAVIGLPENIFFQTSIPSCILIFKKCKQEKGVKIVDGSKFFKKEKTKNVLTNENIDQIFNAYCSKEDIKNVSKHVSLEELEENDFNLNVAKYIYEEEVYQELDLEEFNKNMDEIQESKNNALKALYKAHEELGIKVNLGRVW